MEGAADYVTKTSEPRELLARIVAALRKSAATAPVLRWGALTLDTVAHAVTVGDVAVKLTHTEYAILKLLMQNPTQMLTKSLLLDRISLDTPDCTESSLKIHVSNLRKKLREADGGDYVEAVWGIGFKLREPG